MSVPALLPTARCTNVATFEILPFTRDSCGAAEISVQKRKQVKESDMKKPEKEVRSLVMKFRVNAEEKKTIQQHIKKSTERSRSNYLRKIALREPVTIRYRNDSADDFLRDMLDLRKQLNGIGNNFNQAVHKLHTLDRIPDFRHWIVAHEQLQNQVVASIENIRLRINQLYDQWLQK